MTLASVVSRVLAVGNPTGDRPTVLLVHGFTDSADTWREVLRRLGSHGIYAVALDMPQFGHVIRTPPGQLSKLHDAFLSAAISHYDTGCGAVLVGNSLGGWASIRAAADPELPVCAVVAVSPAGLRTRGLVGGLAHRAIPTHLVSRLPWLIPSSSLSQWLWAHIVGALYNVAVRPGPLPPGTLRRYREHVQRGDPRLWLTIGVELIDEVTAPSALPIAELRRPLHLIWGTRDRLVTASGAVTAARSNPTMVTTELLRGIGHCAQLQRPDVVVAAIRNQLTVLADRHVT
ncbi:alpha/beta fold hydrolase [Williamsia sterculiae]|uniref:alpha/beta fold hydrolase n=1 Tax=Williamsia sterculiae TaxID=1344003 RepID=UPI0013566726|nr:alpha/beta hydrolase [Williamsia sterculiae]